MDLVIDSGVTIWFVDEEAVVPAFELMRRYANVPMDFADASLVVAAETLGTRKIFTIDRKDFTGYRIRRWHRHLSFEMMV